MPTKKQKKIIAKLTLQIKEKKLGAIGNFQDLLIGLYWIYIYGDDHEDTREHGMGVSLFYFNLPPLFLFFLQNFPLSLLIVQIEPLDFNQILY